MRPLRSIPQTSPTIFGVKVHFIPRVRPGAETVAKLDYILLRLTAGGAIYLSLVCVLPEVMALRYSIPLSFGGTGLLIIVGVCMQTVARDRRLSSFAAV